jgi:hypothetical protein
MQVTFPHLTDSQTFGIDKKPARKTPFYGCISWGAVASLKGNAMVHPHLCTPGLKLMKACSGVHSTEPLRGHGNTFKTKVCIESTTEPPQNYILSFLEVMTISSIILCDSTLEKVQLGGKCQKLLEACKVNIFH